MNAKKQKTPKAQEPSSQDARDPNIPKHKTYKPVCGSGDTLLAPNQQHVRTADSYQTTLWHNPGLLAGLVFSGFLFSSHSISAFFCDRAVLDSDLAFAVSSPHENNGDPRRPE